MNVKYLEFVPMHQNCIYRCGDGVFFNIVDAIHKGNDTDIVIINMDADGILNFPFPISVKHSHQYFSKFAKYRILHLSKNKRYIDYEEFQLVTAPDNISQYVYDYGFMYDNKLPDLCDVAVQGNKIYLEPLYTKRGAFFSHSVDEYIHFEFDPINNIRAMYSFSDISEEDTIPAYQLAKMAFK